MEIDDTAPEDIVGLDSSIIMHPRVWEASGHVGNFKDPMLAVVKLKAATGPTNFVLRHKQDETALMFVHHESALHLLKKIKKILKTIPQLRNRYATRYTSRCL